MVAAMFLLCLTYIFILTRKLRQPLLSLPAFAWPPPPPQLPPSSAPATRAANASPTAAPELAAARQVN